MSANVHGQTFPMRVKNGSVTFLVNRIRKMRGYNLVGSASTGCDQHEQEEVRC